MSIRPRHSARLTPRLAFDLSLYLVVGPDATAGRDVTSVALAAVRGGATMIQLRYKTGASEIMQSARTSAKATPRPPKRGQPWGRMQSSGSRSPAPTS